MGLFYVSTSSAKQRAKRKPTKAQRELQASEQRMIEKWENTPKFSHSKPRKEVVTKQVTVTQPDRPKSLMTPGGSTALKPTQQYTGTKMLGIGQLHKSNAVPVFQSEDAVDLAKMRR